MVLIKYKLKKIIILYFKVLKEGVIIFDGLKEKTVWKSAWPICLGYLPLGFACGVLAQKVGLTVSQTGIMSLLVFAGSGQFIAAAMIGGGASIVSIVVTIFIVNLRHLLYSSSLGTYLLGQSKKFLTIFPQGITDETFAVNMIQFSSGNWDAKKALALNLIAHSSWIFSNMLGNVAGNIINVDSDIVNYTLTAMFIALWSYHFNNKLMVLTGVFSGILALVLSGYLDNKLHIVVATVVATTLACFIEGNDEEVE